MRSRVLVHLHLYYHNQLDFMIKKLKSINNCEWDLFVTVCEDNPISVAKISEFKPDAKIIKVENIGYDIFPFIQVLNMVNLKDYDFILKIHTKNFQKNIKRTKRGYKWRNKLIAALLDSKKIFQDNLNLFKTNPKIGMIASHNIIAKMGEINSEEDYLFTEMCKKYKLPASLGKFVAGTMFIARAECFDVIKNMNFTEKDFTHEKHITGDKETTAHTLERMYSRIIEMQNFEIYERTDKQFRLKQFFKNLKCHTLSIFATKSD